MEQLLEVLNRYDAEERIPVIRIELDYELATLHEAIQCGDLEAIERAKLRLEELRREMLLLEI
ncbi:hypothetical protein [Rubeoparvulum massiliense]|uniref:hypothetical protein n=1 Tax=Rubeoparvulum massiliense TaxID=1631346 RepID=UPI00065DD262|nr:hypothetical protein [Rubeoparvulum massiliense]